VTWVLGLAGLITGTVILWAIYQLFAQNGRLLLRVEALEKQLIEEGLLPPSPDPGYEGLPAGTLLNDFCLSSLSGGTRTLYEHRGRRVLLLFVDPQCSFSCDLLAALSKADEAVSDPTPIVISTGDPGENRGLIEKYPIPYPVLLQQGTELSSLYRLGGTPAGYLVDADGATVGRARVGAQWLLRSLRIGRASGQPLGKQSKPLTESRLNRDGLKAGTEAPNFTLPTLDGAELSLRDFRGNRVLLVFSDPGCRPCMQIAPELEHIHRSARDLRVVMVSRGSVEDNRAKATELCLTFPVALQRHWEISRLYAMFATPIAYLIDEQGTIVSDVAAGGEPILKLASSRAELAVN
jgi:peroxiredoxin